MKILFLGYAVNPAETAHLTGVSVAGNKMQANILKEASKDKHIKLSVITVFPAAPYPHDKKIWYGYKKIKVVPGVMASRPGFCNIPVLKQITQILSVYNCAKRHYHIDKDTILLTYNMYPQTGIPAVWLKRKYGCRICTILADLPVEDFKRKTCSVRYLLRKSFSNLTEKLIRQCDQIAALNEHAVKIFAPEVPYIIVEGGIPSDTPKSYRRRYALKRKNLLYSGALTGYSGIMDLIRAMDMVTNQEVELDIYGDGYLEGKIKKAAEHNLRIRYHQSVSNTRMLRIQKQAYALINPRPVDNPVAKVTFPSKIFEYMLSGRPVITTKLNGLSADFLENLYVTESDTPQGMAKEIDKVMSLPEKELSDKAQAAFSFVVDNMTWDKQWGRISDFMKNNYEDWK